MTHPGHHAALTPDKPAVIMAGSGEVITYKELDDRSNQLVHHLRNLGLDVGSHVALFAENHPRYLEVYWAALRSGLYLTAINRYLSPEEAAYLVNDSGSTVLITTAAKADTATAMLDLIPDCPHRLMMDGAVDGFEAYEAVVGAMPTEPLAEQPVGDCMLYSSGTTGRPKGIKRPLSGLMIDDPERRSIAMLERLLLGMTEETNYLSPAPLYHAAPLQWGAGLHEFGGTLVVMERFDAEDYLRFVEQYSISASQLVPTMFTRMLKLPEDVRERYDVSSLEVIIHSAAPCPIPVKEQMIEWWGPIINEYYAGTEANGLCFITSEQWLEHKGSVGTALVGTLHICDEDGNELPTGETGLIYFERDDGSFEYHNDPDKTAASRHPVHPTWSKLGDIGRLDEDGFLYLAERADFMIISGGVNIYPAEIEACFALHPKVADVAVFGLPDADMGEYVHAVIQPEEGVVADDALAEELRAFAAGEIARYKVPRVIDFRDEFPRLPTGKLYKKPLRQEYIDALG